MINSYEWIQEPGEQGDAFIARNRLQLQQFSDMVNRRGLCYVVKLCDGSIRAMWEDEINISKLKEEVSVPFGAASSCPLCQPYDSEGNRRMFMARIIDPRYPNGFIDTDGIATKCVCIYKGVKRERLKFIS